MNHMAFFSNHDGMIYVTKQLKKWKFYNQRGTLKSAFHEPSSSQSSLFPISLSQYG